MDPVCHTLVGATLARSGLSERTPLAAATLIIGANIPDVDVLTYLAGPTWALALRRGITHGITALAVWPFVLVGAMVLWDRWVRRRRRPDLPPPSTGSLLMLAAVAVATHPILDFLNTYGMRWFMPVSGDWVYGDTLFIVDPWVWAALAIGWVASGRWRSPMPARVALSGFLGYVIVLGVAGRLATREVSGELARLDLGQASRVMLSPVPVTPLKRFVVAEIDRGYRFGTYDFLGSPRLTLDSLELPRYRADHVPPSVSEDPAVRRFLSWARFPYVDIVETDEGAVVWIGDGRYTLDPQNSWASVSVPLEE